VIPSLKQQTIVRLQKIQIGLGPVSKPGKRWVKIQMLIKSIYWFMFQKEPEYKIMQLTLFRRRLQTERVPSPLNTKEIKEKNILDCTDKSEKVKFEKHIFLFMKHVARNW
jgi:hypothetical protein